MIRKAFVMTLKPDCRQKYERRHDPIWPELRDVLKQQGVHNYSIFIERETNRLFAYAEIESEELWQQIADTVVCQRWWAHMKELLETNSDHSPVMVVLDEVFHLE